MLDAAINGADTYGGVTTLLVFLILALAWVVGFSSRLFAIVRFESIIHGEQDYQKFLIT